MKVCLLAAFAALLLVLAEGGFCSSGSDISNHSTKVADGKEAVRCVVPAYVDYIPFEWEDFRSVPRQEVADGLHKAIRIGIDKEQATSTRSRIVQIISLSDIQALRTLLKAPQNTTHTKSFGDTRFLFDADRGETQIFVDQGGLVSQGTRLWQLSPQDFAQLKQLLERIYTTLPGQR